MTRFNRLSRLGVVLGLALAQLSVHAAFDPTGKTVPASTQGSRLQVQVDQKTGERTIAMRMASPMCTYLSKRCAGGDGKACEAYFNNC